MRYMSPRSVVASTLAVALAAGSAPARSGPQIESGRTAPAPACSLSVFPSEVSAGRPDARVLVETSERLTGSPTAEVPASSGIEIRDVEPDISPDSWVLRLDLSEAEAGRWTVELRGRSVECTGELSIQAGGATSGDSGRASAGVTLPPRSGPAFPGRG